MRDKVIVVTGASSGIGAVFAELAASHGAYVAIAARREQALADVASRCDGQALTVVADVTKRDDVKCIRDATLDRFGHIDVWINNAGRGISRLVSELTDEDFDDMMLVNVKSALYGMQEVLPHFIDRGRGHLINVSSMLGRVPFAPVRSAYSASKHALNSLTANLRMELAASNPDIHVSTVLPGVVATDFSKNALHGGMDSRSFPQAQSPEEVAAVIAAVIATPQADVYTRDGARALVAGYFEADDMGAVEQAPPFMGAPPKSARSE